MLHVTLVAALLTAAPPPSGGIMTLDNAWARALRDSDDLETLRAAVDRARAAKRRAIAAMLPGLTASGQYRLNEEEVKTNGLLLRRQHEITGSLSITWSLFDGRALPAWSAAKQQVALANLSYEDGRSALMVEVASLYYSVLAAEQLVEVAKSAVAARKQHLEAARARLAANHAVRLDVERADAAVHRAERDLIDARHQLEKLRDSFAVSIGADPPLRHSLHRSTIETANDVRSFSETVAIERGLERRLDLEVLRGNLVVADTLSATPWWSMVPRLSLTGRLDFSQTTFNRPDAVTPSLTLNATWALYDGGSRYADLDEHAAAIRQARAALRRAERGTRAEIREALRSIETGAAAMSAARAEEAAARRALEAANTSFSLGNATGLDVIDAQLEHEQSRSAIIREALNLKISRITLRRAVGDLDPKK